MAQGKRRLSKRYSKTKSDKKASAFAITFVCLIVIILLIGVAFYFLKGQKKVVASREQKKVVLTDEDKVKAIDEKIRAILSNLNEDSLDEYRVLKTKKFLNVYYKITVDKDEYEPLKEKICDVLSNNGYKLKSQNLILASKDNININVELFFKGLKEIIPEKKVEPQIHKYIGKIAIILDDGGFNIELAKKVASLPYPITVSILPFTPYDKETAEILRKGNKKVFLHIPLQPYGYPKIDPGKGAILLNTPRDLIDIIINKDIERIGSVDGCNNHMGSAYTEDKDKITLVIKSLSRYVQTFVDSRTTSKSEAYNVCKSILPKCGYNHMFIDNDENKEAILKKIAESYQLTLKKGSIIIIGHLRHNTVEALIESMPIYNDKGVKFVFVNEAI